MYRCNLLVMGFAKCGTSSLHSYLDLHPEITMSDRKEPHFFTFPDRYCGGPNQHNLLFTSDNPDARYWGESSTTYSVWEPAIERISTSIPEARIILIVRDPIERAISHFRWMWSLGLEPYRKLSDAVKHELQNDASLEDHRNGNWAWYIRASRYSHFVQLIAKAIDPTRIMIVRSDRLSSNRFACLNLCFEFLEVSLLDSIPEIRNNQTRPGRPPNTSKLTRMFPVFVKARVKQALAKLPRIRRSASVIRTPATIDSAGLQILQNELADDIAWFDQLPHEDAFRCDRLH